MQRDTLNSFLMVLCYSVFFYVFTYFLFQRDMAGLLPTTERLEYNMDSGWYKKVKENGYSFKEGEASNTAFFILFPAIWKISHLNGWGISVLNVLFFAAGFAVFTRVYKLTTVEKLVMISCPAFYFCMIPYTEALFSLLTCLVIFGIYKKSKLITWISLILLATARPTAIILFPAFLIAEIITNDRKRVLHSIGYFFINYGLPILIGLSFMLFYQYFATGIWFAWSKSEIEWGKEFSLPVFPLDSMYGPKLLWLNALGMFLGFLSLILLIWYGVKWLIRNVPQTDKITVVAFLYMTAIMLEKIFFSTKWGTNTTNVYDALRFVFATPFFWVFLYRFTKDKSYKFKHYLGIFLLSNIFWLLFASVVHIQYFIYFNFNTALLLLYMAYADKRNTWPAYIMIAINLVVQVNMFQFFLQNIYHG